MLSYFRKSVFGLSAAMGLMIAGNAYAATYNIILKSAGANLACASGGFSFTKTTAGTFPIGGASVNAQQACFAPGNGPNNPGVPVAPGTFIPGALNVVVQNITTTEPQGPNVEGLTGTLQFTTSRPGDCQGNGNSTLQKTFTITFSYGGSPDSASRTYSVTCVGPGNLTPITGTYDVRNTAASVPEPETLLLMLAGLGGYGLVMRRRRKLRT